MTCPNLISVTGFRGVPGPEGPPGLGFTGPTGAVGDGITDDTAAIQAALDTGRHVFLPRGKYLCSAPLIMKPTVGGSAYGQRLFGESRDGVVLILTTDLVSQNPDTSYNDGFLVMSDHCEVNSLTIYAPHPHTLIGEQPGYITPTPVLGDDNYWQSRANLHDYPPLISVLGYNCTIENIKLVGGIDGIEAIKSTGMVPDALRIEGILAGCPGVNLRMHGNGDFAHVTNFMVQRFGVDDYLYPVTDSLIWRDGNVIAIQAGYGVTAFSDIQSFCGRVILGAVEPYALTKYPELDNAAFVDKSVLSDDGHYMATTGVYHFSSLMLDGDPAGLECWGAVARIDTVYKSTGVQAAFNPYYANLPAFICGHKGSVFANNLYLSCGANWVPPAWSSGTTYKQGVYVTSGGTTWKSKTAVASGGSAPSEGAYWTAEAPPAYAHIDQFQVRTPTNSAAPTRLSVSNSFIAGGTGPHIGKVEGGMLTLTDSEIRLNQTQTDYSETPLITQTGGMVHVCDNWVMSSGAARRTFIGLATDGTHQIVGNYATNWRIYTTAAVATAHIWNNRFVDDVVNGYVTSTKVKVIAGTAPAASGGNISVGHGLSTVLPQGLISASFFERIGTSEYWAPKFAWRIDNGSFIFKDAAASPNYDLDNVLTPGQPYTCRIVYAIGLPGLV